MGEENPIVRAAKIWGSVTALVTALLYVCGFIVIRVHYQVLGISVPLEPLDSRYAVEGAKLMGAALIVGGVLAVLLGVARAFAPSRRKRRARAARAGLQSRLALLGGSLFLAAVLALTLALLGVKDVLRLSQAPEPLLPLFDPVCQLADRGPAPLAVPTLLALILLGALAAASAVALRWWREGRRDLGFGSVALGALICAVAFAALSGVFFNKRDFEKLARPPAGMTTGAPVYVLASDAGKRILFSRAGGEPILQAFDAKTVDAIPAVGDEASLSDLMRVSGCGDH